jgi:hypothetical protein
MSIKINENIYNWAPLKNPVFKDDSLAEEIHEKGHAILPLISDEILAKLNALYTREHTLQAENGGMFYSMYSNDFDYRMRVHTEIGELLAPILEAHFKGYKNIVNSFVVKASGKQSEFYVHQDTTALDEFKHSPLSLWIPLHEINETNGALSIVEKTHWFFSPYRGVSFSFPFKGIVNTVRNYLKPVYMKPGEVLVFDPRIIHNSMGNSSGKDRIAIICGVFEQDAELVTCFKDPANAQSPIELYKHPDDYTLQYPNFFYNCHVRPVTGEKFKEVNALFPEMSAEIFTSLCAENAIEIQNTFSDRPDIQCNLIAEPDGINRDLEPIAVAETPISKKKGILSWFK